jgi:hypothetical protein
MARKPDELKTYIEGICKDKNFTPEQTQLALAVSTGEVDQLTKEQLTQVIIPLIDLTVGRHGDWSREMDAARTAKQGADDDRAKLKAWRDKEIVPLVEQTKSERDKALAKVAKFEAQFGPIDDAEDLGDGTTRTAKGAIVKTEDVDKLVAATEQKMAKEFLSFASDQSRLTKRHADKFKGEILDINPLLEVMSRHANEGRPVGLDDAYTELYGPKITELEQQQRADELKAAEKRGEEAAIKRITAESLKSGAVIPEGSGAFWDQQREAGSTTDSAKLTDQDRAALFGSDFQTRLQENEQSFQRATQ